MTSPSKDPVRDSEVYALCGSSDYDQQNRLTRWCNKSADHMGEHTNGVGVEQYVWPQDKPGPQGIPGHPEPSSPMTRPLGKPEAEAEKVLPWSDLRTNGILWAINRYLFHPRGYALALSYHADDDNEPTGEPTGWAFFGDGSEQWEYATDTTNEMFVAFEAFLMNRARPIPVVRHSLQCGKCTCDMSGPDPDCPQHGMEAHLQDEWVGSPPKTEGMCSYGNCPHPAVWRRKPGWMVAPGSPPGDVCEEHHCWERT